MQVGYATTSTTAHNTTIIGNKILDVGTVDSSPGAINAQCITLKSGLSNNCIISNNFFQSKQKAASSNPPLSAIVYQDGIADTDGGTIFSDNIIRGFFQRGLLETDALYLKGFSNISGNTIELDRESSVGLDLSVKSISAQISTNKISVDRYGMNIESNDNTIVNNKIFVESITANARAGVILGSSAMSNLIRNNNIFTNDSQPHVVIPAAVAQSTDYGNNILNGIVQHDIVNIDNQYLVVKFSDSVIDAETNSVLVEVDDNYGGFKYQLDIITTQTNTGTQRVYSEQGLVKFIAGSATNYGTVTYAGNSFTGASVTFQNLGGNQCSFDILNSIGATMIMTTILTLYANSGDALDATKGIKQVTNSVA